MTETTTRHAGFWDRPAGWKAVLLIVVYLAFYLAVGQLIGLLFGDRIDTDNLLANGTSMFLALVLPIAIGAAALLLFAARVGWLRAIFGPQPVRGSGWMWIAPAVVSAAVVGHLVATDWADWSAEEIAILAVLGLAIGMAEELATRGLAVKILRDAGHSERFVAVASSLLFALMHTVNLLAGMSVKTVLGTVVYTFCFGMCMYLAMRVTGTIWAAIVLHGLTDPASFLASGGVDQDVSGGASNGGDTLALVATLAMMIFGLVAVFLVRGRTQPGLRATT
jgi:uncharacterized protein